MQSWLLQLHSKAWDQGDWFLPLSSSFFKIALATLSPVCFYVSFRIVLSTSTKILATIFIGISLNLYINLGRIDILNLLVHEHGCLSTSLGFLYFYQCFVVFGIQVPYMSVRLTPKYSFVYWVIINGNVFLSVHMFTDNIQKYTWFLYLYLVSYDLAKVSYSSFFFLVDCLGFSM